MTPTDQGDDRPRACRLLELPGFRDTRGLLVAGDPDGAMPFVPVRWFTVSDVPAGAVRARHANATCHELLVCVTGTCVVDAHDGHRWTTYHLDRPDVALHAPGGTWLECREFSPGAVLLVLASHAYDPSDQLDDFDAFIAATAGRDRG